MIITPKDLKNGGDIDFSGHFHHRGRYGRVTVREVPQGGLPRLQVYAVMGTYEVLIHWHKDRSEEVVHTGSLKECVRIANLLTDTDDEVQG